VVNTKNVGPAALSVHMHDCMLFKSNYMAGRFERDAQQSIQHRKQSRVRQLHTIALQTYVAVLRACCDAG